MRIQKSTEKNILRNVYDAKCAVEALPRILESLKTVMSENEENSSFIENTFHGPLKNLLEELENFVNLANMSIDMDYFNVVREFRLSKQVCEQLAEDADKIDELYEKARKWFERQSFSSLDGIDLMFDKNKISIRATKRARTIFGSQLSTKNSGLVETESKNAEHRFSSEKLDSLTEKYQCLQQNYEDSQKEQLEEIRKLAIDYTDLLFSVSKVVSELDCIMSLAQTAQNSSASYVVPEFCENGGYDIKSARHPVLDLVLSSQLIPNDVVLESGIKMCIITGPNMGGKSTYIKMLGLLSVMAQIGSMIPAEACTKIPLFDKILARIGANDQPQHGVSTFMSEMIDTSNLLRQASDKSLVIIDELGRGTSTYDGFGIACAVANELIERNATTFQATHFHEMSKICQEFGPQKVAMKRVGVYEDKENDDILFTFNLEEGNSKGSYGIHCAKIAGIPEKVLKKAQFNAENLDSISLVSQNIKNTTDMEQLKKAVESGDKKKVLELLGQENIEILKINTA